MRILSLLILALAGLAHAAPAPLLKRDQGPECPPVLLNGWIQRDRRPVGSPSVIVRQTDWEAFAKATGIQDPPRVNFKTHFLFVHVSDRYSERKCEIDSSGDLCAHTQANNLRELKCLDEAPSGPCYFIKSFPRSAVKTVNGLPLPR